MSAREVAEWLAEHREVWLHRIFPNGRWERDYFIVAGIDGAKGDSLRIPKNPRKRGLSDFGGGWKGDELSLVSRPHWSGPP